MKNWTEVQVEISVNQLWSDCRLGCPLKKERRDEVTVAHDASRDVPLGFLYKSI